MLSWIFIVLAHWNNSPRIDMSPHSVTLSCMIPDQPVFSLSPYCCVLSREATNTNYIVFSLTRSGIEPTIYHTRRPDQGLNPRSTTLDDPIRDWTHDLPHSTTRSGIEPTIYHTRRPDQGLNPRSTTLDASMLTITLPMWSRHLKVADIYYSKEGNAQWFLSPYMYKMGLVSNFPWTSGL